MAMNRSELIQRAVIRVADRRIREAREQGAFEDLAGAGEPLPDIDEPYDPLWWVRKWLKREQLNKGQARKMLMQVVSRNNRQAE